MTNSRVNDKKVASDIIEKFLKANTKEEKEHILSIAKLLNVEINELGINNSDSVNTDNMVRSGNDF